MSTKEKEVFKSSKMVQAAFKTNALFLLLEEGYSIPSTPDIKQKQDTAGNDYFLIPCQDPLHYSLFEPYKCTESHVRIDRAYNQAVLCLSAAHHTAIYENGEESIIVHSYFDSTGGYLDSQVKQSNADGIRIDKAILDLLKYNAQQAASTCLGNLVKEKNRCYAEASKKVCGYEQDLREQVYDFSNKNDRDTCLSILHALGNARAQMYRYMDIIETRHHEFELAFIAKLTNWSVEKVEPITTNQENTLDKKKQQVNVGGADAFKKQQIQHWVEENKAIIAQIKALGPINTASQLIEANSLALQLLWLSWTQGLEKAKEVREMNKIVSAVVKTIPSYENYFINHLETASIEEIASLVPYINHRIDGPLFLNYFGLDFSKREINLPKFSIAMEKKCDYLFENCSAYRNFIHGLPMLFVDGFSYLFWMIFGHRTRGIEMLLRHGFDVNAPAFMSDGQLISHMRMAIVSSNYLPLLIKYGTKIDPITKNDPCIIQIKDSKTTILNMKKNGLKAQDYSKLTKISSNPEILQCLKSCINAPSDLYLLTMTKPDYLIPLSMLQSSSLKSLVLSMAAFFNIRKISTRWFFKSSYSGVYTDMLQEPGRLATGYTPELVHNIWMPQNKPDGCLLLATEPDVVLSPEILVKLASEQADFFRKILLLSDNVQGDKLSVIAYTADVALAKNMHALVTVFREKFLIASEEERNALLIHLGNEAKTQSDHILKVNFYYACLLMLAQEDTLSLSQSTVFLWSLKKIATTLIDQGLLSEFESVFSWALQFILGSAYGDILEKDASMLSLMKINDSQACSTEVTSSVSSIRSTLFSDVARQDVDEGMVLAKTAELS